MLTIDPKDISTAKFHSYMLGSVVPRPIAFASTMDSDGNVNLSPYSFFNAFSANPPILVFSPARRVRDNTTKHTLENVLEHPEVVINTVDFEMAEQMSLSSTEYGKGVNEFIKAGLSMAESVKVKPPRVAESPVAFECKVNEVIPLGEEGGAGNLVICEIVLAHFQDRILDADQRIDPMKLEAVSRLGGNWYSRLSPDSLFEIAKPLATLGIGVDQIPERIRSSHVLTGNDLGRLGNVEALPSQDAVLDFSRNQEIEELKSKHAEDPEGLQDALHRMARERISEGRIEEAWKILLQ